MTRGRELTGNTRQASKWGYWRKVDEAHYSGDEPFWYVYLPIYIFFRLFYGLSDNLDTVTSWRLLPLSLFVIVGPLYSTQTSRRYTVSISWYSIGLRYSCHMRTSYKNTGGWPCSYNLCIYVLLFILKSLSLGFQWSRWLGNINQSRSHDSAYNLIVYSSGRRGAGCYRRR